MAISINIGDATVIQLVGAFYESVLNGVGTFEVGIDGAGTALRTAATTGERVDFYLDGTLDFSGYIKVRTAITNGGLRVQGNSILEDFTEQDCPITAGKKTKTYTSTDDDTIFSDLVGEVTGWTADVTGSTATSVDAFRVSESMSVWQGIIKLIRQTGKDVDVDWENKTLLLVDKKGTADQFSFIEGRDVANVRETKRKQKASKVIVYGYGDGENQIFGEAGTGTPVQRIIDRNIISETAANQRATTELAKVSSEVINYQFSVIKPNVALQVGDQGTLTAGSYGIDEEAIDVVRIVRSIDAQGTQKIETEVTNPDYRQASKKLEQLTAESEANSIISESTMLGTGNLQTYSAAMNAKLGAPLRRIFYLSADDIQDEAGNLRVDRMTLDWDIDPYRSEFGTVSETNQAPSLAAGSADSHKHDPSDSGHVHSISTPTTDSSSIFDFQGSSGSNFNVGISTSNVTVASETVSSGTYSMIFVNFEFDLDSSGNPDIYWDILVDGTIYERDFVSLMPQGARIQRNYCLLVNQSFGSSFNVQIGMRGSSSGLQVDIYNMQVFSQDANHSHDVTALTGTQIGVASVDDDNRSPGLAGNAASHNHAATIGDDVSDAASVNASNTQIYLDFYDTGTGSWVNKRTWTSQPLLQEDFDLTDGGTYPDAVGYWRVRVEPTSTSPDFTQCIVRVKHHMDN